MNYREYDSSWSKLQNSTQGTIITPNHSVFANINGWDIRLSGYLYENTDLFWFDEDDDGGMGGTEFSGTAILDKGKDTIEMDFWLSFAIFGDKDNTDEFYMMSHDRGLDQDSGVEYDITDATTIDKHIAVDFIEDNKAEIFDALYDAVIDEIPGFGY